MTYKEFNNLSVGDIVEVINRGSNKGKICRVTNIKWVPLRYCTCVTVIDSVEIELVDPNEVFLCNRNKGKRRTTYSNYASLKLIKKES